MRKMILICYILLLPTAVYPQMTAKYKGVQVSESIQADFDSLLERFPTYLELHQQQCGRYNQPNIYTVAELLSEEEEGMLFYCLLTDNSIVKEGIFDHPGYMYKFNDLINIVLMARKSGTLIGYGSQIVFYFLNTNGDYLAVCAIKNGLYFNISTLNRPFIYVPFEWRYGTILVYTDYAKINFSLYNEQKIKEFFAYPFQSKQILKKAVVLYVDTNKRSKQIATLRPGEEIELLSWYQEWYKVKYFEKIGWIWAVELR